MVWCTMVGGDEEKVVGVGVTTDVVRGQLVVEGVWYLLAGAWWTPD